MRIGRMWEKTWGSVKKTYWRLQYFTELHFQVLQAIKHQTHYCMPPSSFDTSPSGFLSEWSLSLWFSPAWNLFWLKCFCVHSHMQIRLRHSNHNFVTCVRFYVKHFKIHFWKLKEENMAIKNIAFSAVVREFHVYKKYLGTWRKWKTGVLPPGWQLI